MPSFDFITDENFRTVLEADQKEMRQCAESKAWKAVHVLAGSIIEAVLIDYLIAEEHVVRDDALKMDLGKAVKLAAEKGIISEKAAALSSVIKEYRNLIHPGRSIRMAETTSAASARIAESLVEMILTEIEGQKRSHYGYTAEQIVSKIEQDSFVGAILNHLLEDLNRSEMERLLLKIIPERYMAEPESPIPYEGDEQVLKRLADLFRTAYEKAGSQLQARVTRKFVQILKEERQEFIFAYSRAFFRMSDLRHLSDADIQLVKSHFFAQIKSDKTDYDLILAFSGIGKYILPDEVLSFVDPLVQTMCLGNTEDTIRAARERIIDESVEMEEKVKYELNARLDQWIELYSSRKDSRRADLVEELKFNTTDVPF